jgi:hypothetical protein
MRAVRGLALGLVLATGAASADLCNGCSIAMDFANGGSITADDATIQFSAGGVLTLGTAGAITFGTGGSITPNVDPPDMSGGGTLVLGTGGSITFGTGGLLDTGSAGDIELAESGDLQVNDAVSVAIDAPQDVHLGTLDAGAAARVTAAGSIDELDLTTPIDLHTTGDIAVGSGHNVTYASIAGATVELDDGADNGGFCSTDCPPAGGSTIGSPNIPTESNTLGPQAQGTGGTMGLWGLLIGLAARGRRRR